MDKITLNEYFNKGGRFEDLKEFRQETYGKLPRIAPNEESVDLVVVIKDFPE